MRRTNILLLPILLTSNFGLSGGISGGGPGSIAREELAAVGGTIGGSGTGLELTLESQYISPKMFKDISTAALQNRIIVINRIPAEAKRIDLESRSIELQLATLKDPLLLETVEEEDIEN